MAATRTLTTSNECRHESYNCDSDICAASNDYSLDQPNTTLCIYLTGICFLLDFSCVSFIVSLVKLFVRHIFFCFELHINEFTAYKKQACWWAHDHSLYFYFVWNKFLCNPFTATLIAPSRHSNPINKVWIFLIFKTFFSFALAFERIVIKMHCNESSLVMGPEIIFCLQACT